MTIPPREVKLVQRHEQRRGTREAFDDHVRHCARACGIPLDALAWCVVDASATITVWVARCSTEALHRFTASLGLEVPAGVQLDVVLGVPPSGVAITRDDAPSWSPVAWDSVATRRALDEFRAEYAIAFPPVLMQRDLERMPRAIDGRAVAGVVAGQLVCAVDDHTVTPAVPASPPVDAVPVAELARLVALAPTATRAQVEGRIEALMREPCELVAQYQEACIEGGRREVAANRRCEDLLLVLRNRDDELATLRTMLARQAVTIERYERDARRRA